MISNTPYLLGPVAQGRSRGKVSARPDNRQDNDSVQVPKVLDDNLGHVFWRRCEDGGDFLKAEHHVLRLGRLHRLRNALVFVKVCHERGRALLRDFLPPKVG